MEMAVSQLVHAQEPAAEERSQRFRAPAAAEDPAQSKARIIGAAIAVFSAEGFRNATLEQIARDAGVTVEQILALFCTKEGLHEAMMRELTCWAHAAECLP